MLPTQLMVADDHHLVRIGLRQILETQTNWKVVAEAQNGREAVRLALNIRPDVAILDIGMPELNGVEACEQIVAAGLKTKVLIVSMHQNDLMIKKVLGAGARGYLLKTDAPRDLVGAVEALRSNRTFFTANVSGLIVEGFLNPRANQIEKTTLTPRQREVVQLIAEGKSNKEIATALDISKKTAETHRANLMRRMNFHSITDVVRYAVRNEIIQP